jgi:hypothetical protein
LFGLQSSCHNSTFDDDELKFCPCNMIHRSARSFLPLTREASVNSSRRRNQRARALLGAKSAKEARSLPLTQRTISGSEL